MTLVLTEKKYGKFTQTVEILTTSNFTVSVFLVSENPNSIPQAPLDLTKECSALWIHYVCVHFFLKCVATVFEEKRIKIIQ